MRFNIKDDHVVSDVNENVVDVAKKLKENRRFNHVIILDGKKPVGIVSIRDVVERVVAEERDVKNTKVSDIMTSPVVTIKENQDTKEIADMMIKNSFLSLPIVNENDGFLGVVSIYDVLAKLKENQKK